jgi:hypothetical protein
MSTTTHRIAITETAYTNVSNGNLNCTLLNGENHCRLVVGGSEPKPDTADFVAIRQSGMAAAHNLEAEDDIWVRAESGPMEVMVIRGPATIALAAG